MPKLFDRLFNGLAKTRQRIIGPLEDMLSRHGKIDQELFEELEEILVCADVGMATAARLLEDLKDRVKKERIDDPQDVRRLLLEAVAGMLKQPAKQVDVNTPQVIMVVGVNGVGKTTSIAKLAAKFRSEAVDVLLVAGDTFRAAASEQLSVWADRLKIPIVAHREGGDPAAVVFDGLASANAQHIPVVIIDTAGRLHTKQNLLSELGKVRRIIEQNKGDRVFRVFLVLDATTGQNAIAQAKAFREVSGIDGIVLTKLDGTAKGGIVLAIADQLQLPIAWIGVGESADDLRPFDPEEFASALFTEE